MVEVNPLAESPDGKLIAADSKLGFDDNAVFRQKELFALNDESQNDPRCATLLGCSCMMPCGGGCFRA